VTKTTTAIDADLGTGKEIGSFLLLKEERITATIVLVATCLATPHRMTAGRDIATNKIVIQTSSTPTNVTGSEILGILSIDELKNVTGALHAIDRGHHVTHEASAARCKANRFSQSLMIGMDLLKRLEGCKVSIMGMLAMP